MVQEFLDLRKKHCQFVMNDSKNLELLKKEHFDIAIGEMFEACGFGVFEVLGIKKYITTHSSSLSITLDIHSGVPQAPSILPAILGEYTDKMNFLQRVKNFITLIFEKYTTDNMMLVGSERAIKEIFPGFDIKVGVYNYHIY